MSFAASASLKHTGARALVATLAVALTLLCSEVLVRVTGFGRPAVSHHGSFIRHHPLLGWKNAPSTTVNFPGGITKATNSHGFRGPEHPYEKPDGEYRILLLGDSYTDGYSVNQDEVVTEVLSHRLNGRVGRHTFSDPTDAHRIFSRLVFRF